MTYRITLTGDPEIDAKTISDGLADLLGTRENEVCVDCLTRILSGTCVGSHGSEQTPKETEVMTEDIWDEIWNKPSLNFLLNHPDELWLKEVKVEGDRLNNQLKLIKELVSHKSLHPSSAIERIRRILEIDV